MLARIILGGLLMLAALFAGGCATSTIESRKQERSAAYTSLAPEQRSAVDQGQIKVGMNMDAVYMAWGKPSGILSGESTEGALITWLYHDTYYEYYPYYPYWSYAYCYGPRPFYGGPYYFGYGYQPHTYVRAEVHFLNGLVHEWRSLPRPHY